MADAFLSGVAIGGADGGADWGADWDADGDADVLLLRNVTLGLHSGELDCVLVRVNRSETESAFVDAIPQDGDGTTGRRTLARRGRTAAAARGGQDDDDDDEKNRARRRPAVEVMAVFEFKRNPDDVARGFHSRQMTLAWLAGDEASYDPREWANRRHPSGHFRRGYHPMKLARWVRGGGGGDGSRRKGREGGGADARQLPRVSSHASRRRGTRWILPGRGVAGDAASHDVRSRRQGERLVAFTRAFFFGFRLCRLVLFPVPTRGTDSFAFGQRIWDAIALGPRGSSAVSASFIA